MSDWTGYGTPLAVPSTIGPTAPAISCVSLGHYAAHLGIDECGVWGVQWSGQVDAACGSIWTKFQRDSLSEYLQQAQDLIEGVINYPLCPRYIVEDNKPFKTRIHTRWKRVIETGVQATSVIATGTPVDYSSEPALIGPIPALGATTDEVIIEHAGTTYAIEPSGMVLSGGNLTIAIPRCRLVLPALWNNPAAGLDYTDLTNFAATVDVSRLYTDTTTQATLVWPTGKHACPECAEETDTACEVIVNPLTGYLTVLRTDATGAVVTGNCWTDCSCHPQYVRLAYKAGLPVLSVVAQDAIIRLAHSLMPEGPCGCDIAQQHWKRDRNVPDYVAPERMNNPWGYSDGAWFAWLFTRQLELKRVSVL